MVEELRESIGAVPQVRRQAGMPANKPHVLNGSLSTNANTEDTQTPFTLKRSLAEGISVSMGVLQKIMVHTEQQVLCAERWKAIPRKRSPPRCPGEGKPQHHAACQPPTPLYNALQFLLPCEE